MAIRAVGTPSAAQLALHPGYLASRTYVPWEGTSGSSAVPAVDRIYFWPFRLLSPIVFTNGILRVTTGGATSAVKAGIWANSPTSNRPVGVPLAVDNTGAATTSSASNATLAFGAGSLGVGFYWGGTKFTGTLPSCWSIAGSNQFTSMLMGLDASSNIATFGFSLANSYANDMPTIAEGETFTAVTTSGIPLFGLVT